MTGMLAGTETKPSQRGLTDPFLRHFFTSLPSFLAGGEKAGSGFLHCFVLNRLLSNHTHEAGEKSRPGGLDSPLDQVAAPDLAAWTEGHGRG